MSSRLNYPDLENLSDNELKVLISQANQLLDQHASKRIEEVKGKIKELAHSIGMECYLTRQNRIEKNKIGLGKVPPKYQNPNNLEETWTGRGRLPRWIQLELQQGRSLEDFKIQQAS